MEKQSAASCPVLGGKKMVLSGHNFLQDSKVIFVEKAPGISVINRPSECCLRGVPGGLVAGGGGWPPGASMLRGRSRSLSSRVRPVLMRPCQRVWGRRLLTEAAPCPDWTHVCFLALSSCCSVHLGRTLSASRR